MAAPAGDSEDTHGLDYYEAVPYVLVVESVERGGQWRRRAEYPELPGCAAEADSVPEALDQLERERYRVLRKLWERGDPIPVPRPPLSTARALVEGGPGRSNAPRAHLRDA
jgi:predicted RNase H-like HicB family nuclease